MLDLLTVEPKFTRPASREAAAAIDRYLRPTSAANPPAAAAAVDRRDRRTDGHLTIFMMLIAYMRTA